MAAGFVQSPVLVAAGSGALAAANCASLISFAGLTACIVATCLVDAYDPASVVVSKRLCQDHCIWPSIVESAVFTLRDFLTSSAVTYGYSPYSRKLGLWCSRKNLITACVLVRQSSGQPSKFTNTVVMPVELKSAMASSTYLSKSVSKMPWYMKCKPEPTSNKTQRR